MTTSAPSSLFDRLRKAKQSEVICFQSEIANERAKLKWERYVAEDKESHFEFTVDYILSNIAWDDMVERIQFNPDITVTLPETYTMRSIIQFMRVDPDYDTVEGLRTGTTILSHGGVVKIYEVLFDAKRAFVQAITEKEG
jgi:hypothetical protein